MNDDLIVEGYAFLTPADAEIARREVETIEYIESNMTYTNMSKIMQLYDRALDTKMFVTPIGWNYLSKLRNILIENGYVEAEIRSIPIYNAFSRDGENTSIKQKITAPRVQNNQYRGKLVVCIAVIVILICTIIGMFYISMASDTPNMINYRNAIVNEYAQWEQEIKDREDVVRQKEKELNMVSPLPYNERIKEE